MRWSLHRPNCKHKLKLWCSTPKRTRASLPTWLWHADHIATRVISAVGDNSSRRKRLYTTVCLTQRHQVSSHPQPWQARLETFKQLEYESDLDSPALESRRLVDCDDTCNNLDVWLELFLYRRRVHGVQGVRPIWLGLLKRDVPLAYYPSALTIWSILLELGHSDSHVLHQVHQYAEHTYARTGYKYPCLYIDIIRHRLADESWTSTLEWHEKLRDLFPPTSEQYCKLLACFNRKDPSIKFTRFFQKAYEDLSIQGVYATIVPILCMAQSFRAALEWHDFLIKHKDLPATSEPVNQLLDYLSMTQNKQQASKITKNLLDSGVRFISKSNGKLEENEILTKEAMNLIHGKHYGITQKELSDEFCARLFATRFFSVQTTVKGLEILGMQAIGPKAFRELMSRTLQGGGMDSHLALDVLHQLSIAGISIGRSTFARVVKELATCHQVDTLYDIVTCDMHVEAFEDHVLQESLLHQYCETGDERGIQRTLAILLVDTRNDQRRQRQSWNYLLRSAIDSQNWKKISRLLEKMLESAIEVAPRSYRFMIHRLCVGRRAGQRPSVPTNDLDPLINTWQLVMRKGGTIPIALWAEVLTRLGMNGFLHEYEKLALWLVMWFVQPSFRSSQMTVRASQKHTEDSSMLTDRPTAGRFVAHRDANHPIRQLFPPAAVQGIVAWGFHNEKPQFYGDSVTKSSSNARWTWGLRLLCRLQALGSRFSPRTLGKACEIRLIAIFGVGVSGRPRNRQSQAYHYRGRIEYYLSSMEDIMGPTLFQGLYRRSFKLPRASRLRAIGQIIAWKAARHARRQRLRQPGRRGKIS